MTQSLLAIGISLTVLVSPEIQTMLGNGAGQAGSLFFLALAVAAMAQLFTVRLYGHISSSSASDEIKFMAHNLGHPTALFFFLASRVVFMATISTIILVTAGFVFNEVFLYWFPNFGFAFLLLGLMLAANMISPAFAGRLQTTLVATALLAMCILSVAAFMSPGFEVQTQQNITLRALLLPFLMIIGIELFIFSPTLANQNNRNSKSISVALILTVLILMVWGGAMLQLISPEKLANSFNPHMQTARHALGQPGRIIAGVLIIAGVAATVNGLLLALSRQARNLAEQGHLPHLFTKGGQHFPLPLLLLAAFPAILMAIGMAGHDITEVYIRSSLLFWLLHYCAIHLAAFKNNFPAKGLHLFTSLLFAAVTTGLILTDPEKQLLLQSLAYIGMVSALLSFILFFSTNKLSKKRRYPCKETDLLNCK